MTLVYIILLLVGLISTIWVFAAIKVGRDKDDIDQDRDDDPYDFGY